MNDQDTKTEVKAHTRKRQQASTITRPPSARKASSRQNSAGQASIQLANRSDHWSQSFSRSYGSSLPTSLTYIILSTRGCSPWRPNADIGPFREHETPQKPRCFSETTSPSLAEPIPGSPFLN
uniref:Uncharacterized protein n=1 Tax=Caenorhabditis japonica TaxID=281687 RepID=A0A8R1EHK4_CAEJA